MPVRQPRCLLSTACPDVPAPVRRHPLAVHRPARLAGVRRPALAELDAPLPTGLPSPPPKQLAPLLTDVLLTDVLLTDPLPDLRLTAASALALLVHDQLSLSNPTVPRQLLLDLVRAVTAAALAADDTLAAGALDSLALLAMQRARLGKLDEALATRRAAAASERCGGGHAAVPAGVAAGWRAT